MTTRGISEAELAGTKESLMRLADQFHEAADRYVARSRGECEDAPIDPYPGLLSTHSYTAGSLMYEIAAAGQLRLPRLPEKLLGEPIGFDEIGEDGVFYDLWWLAFVGWLETSPLIDFSPRSTPSYPSRVFYVWKPGTPIGAWRSDIDSEPPFASNWLCFQSELCETYGQDACLQSATALEFVVEKLEDERSRQGTRGGNAGSTESATPEQRPAQHSPDFRSVHWFGTDYTFTPTQAAIIKVLWSNWERGTRDIGEAYLLEGAKVSDTSRLVDIFRKNPAWNTMIVSGTTKGTRRLSPPSKT